VVKFFLDSMSLQMTDTFACLSSCVYICNYFDDFKGTVPSRVKGATALPVYFTTTAYLVPTVKAEAVLKYREYVLVPLSVPLLSLVIVTEFPSMVSSKST